MNITNLQQLIASVLKSLRTKTSKFNVYGINVKTQEAAVGIYARQNCGGSILHSSQQIPVCHCVRLSCLGRTRWTFSSQLIVLEIILAGTRLSITVDCE